MSTIRILHSKHLQSSHDQIPHDVLPIPLDTQEHVNPANRNDETQRHVLGVKPSGNSLTSTRNLQIAMGIYGRLPDAMLLLLFEFFDESSLISIGATCRGLFAYSVYDQLWRDISVNDMRPNFQWRGSWRSSRRRLPRPGLPNVDCSCLFSDALYRPFQCSQLCLARFALNIPKRNQIAHLSDLTHAEFCGNWTDRPFILRDPVKKWKSFKGWTEEYLLSHYGSITFRAEAVDWPLETYIEYMYNNSDESPLYLFDRTFVEKMKLEIGRSGDYEPPDCFGEDLFTLLGEQRPDHRWLIIGPARSGSTFHKDPNATSAWNAVIRGSKYWIMFPNSVVPPGVYMSEDQSEVTSPLSIAEWMLTFHNEARQTSGCVEGICHEGEVLHVPSGWWHLVVNLEPSIAVTQNFIPRTQLRAAVNFLKNKADQVSGFKDEVVDPYALFMEKLRQTYPDLCTVLQAQTDRKRKWEEVTQINVSEQAGRQGFNFGFSDDLEEDEAA